MMRAVINGRPGQDLKFTIRHQQTSTCSATSHSQRQVLVVQQGSYRSEEQSLPLSLLEGGGV